MAVQGGGDGAFDLRDGAAHPLAAIACGVAVAQLDRLVAAGRGTGGNRGRGPAAARQDDGHGQRRVAAGIEDFLSLKAGDAAAFDHPAIPP